MNSALTHAADMPLTRRTDATKALRKCAIAALLLAAPADAFAADMGTRIPPPLTTTTAAAPAPIPYLYSWTGFYVGGNIGGGWESTTVDDPFLGVSFSNNRSGFIGGGQVGYNWQLSPQFVVGVEGTFDGADIRSTDTGTSLFGATAGDLLASSAKVDWIATVAARFGLAANNWLFYGKVGGGWVHDTVTLADLSAPGLFTSQSDSKGGWLAGAGIEYGITQNWTVRVEYDHLGLNSTTGQGPTFDPFDTANISRHFDMVTAGLNYKF
jgi:outer membrane immunogenic protein